MAVKLPESGQNGVILHINLPASAFLDAKQQVLLDVPSILPAEYLQHDQNGGMNHVEC
jgi:hypothetical protein